MVRPLGAGEFGLGEVVVLYVYSKSSNRAEVYPKKMSPNLKSHYWRLLNSSD